MSARGEQPGGSAPLAWLTLAALGVLAFATGIKKLRTPDYWWHLSTGYWIAEQGRVPHEDVFTYTVHGAPYVDIHWLFQLALAGIHSLAGHDGVIVVRALLAVALVAILAAVGWRRERPFVSGLTLGAMLLVVQERMLVRPETPTFVLLAAVLALLERNERRSDAWVFAIVPLQLLWANLHGLFALGIALCGFYLVSAWFEARRGVASERDWRRLAGVTVLSSVVCLLTPNGLAGVLYPLQQLAMIGPLGDAGGSDRNVRELWPVWSGGVPWQWLVLPALLLLATAASFVANWRHDRSRLAHAATLGSFALLAALANRNLALFAIVAAPLCVRNTNEWLDRRPLRISARMRGITSLAVVLALAAASVDVASGRFYARMHMAAAPGLGYIDIFVPEAAIDWIERERPPGPIAHPMGAGGYLNWRLFPDYAVMVDGRLEVFGPRRLAELRLTTPDAFGRLDAEYHFGTVLLLPLRNPPDFVKWMVQNPEWRLVYADAAGMVFVREVHALDARWPRIDTHARDLLPPFRGGSGPIADAERQARARLLFALGRNVEARAEWPAGRNSP